VEDIWVLTDFAIDTRPALMEFPESDTLLSCVVFLWVPWSWSWVVGEFRELWMRAMFNGICGSIEGSRLSVLSSLHKLFRVCGFSLSGGAPRFGVSRSAPSVAPLLCFGEMAVGV